MTVDNADTADKGTNQGDPGADKSDDQSVSNKADSTEQQDTTDQTTEGQKADDASKDPEGTQLTKDVKIETDKTDVPDKYDTFKLPEGFTMDEGALLAFNPVAKELGLNQEKAQSVIDLYANIQRKNAEKIQSLFEDEHKASIEKVKADPEMGGESYGANMRIAGNVIGTFGSKGVLESLTSTGLGDNPDIIRMFIRIGKAMGEDVLIDKNDGGGSGTKPKSFGELLYDKMD